MNVNGTGKTLLAPTNTAFDGFMKLYPNASDTEFTGDILSYHLLSGNFTGSSFAMGACIAHSSCLLFPTFS